MDSKLPNVEMLRQLYEQNRFAKAFFDHAAGRERDQSETKVDRILVRLKRDGNEFSRREIIDLFRKLQEQGCGQFVEGRRGWPSRFVWSSEMTSIGRAAAGDLHVIENISKEEDALDQLHEDIALCHFPISLRGDSHVKKRECSYARYSTSRARFRTQYWKMIRSSASSTFSCHISRRDPKPKN